MMNFANARPAISCERFINTDFGLSGQVTLTLNTSPAGAGRIEISTITPTSYPWSGVYFNGNPVTITAIPNPGYTFDHFGIRMLQLLLTIPISRLHIILLPTINHRLSLPDLQLHHNYV